MARTATTVVDINTTTSITDNDVAIDATLVTAGLKVSDFFNTREGTRAILITNTSAVATGTVTIQAGTGVNAGLGDLVVDVAQNKQTLIGNLESSRFDQGDGSLYVDFKTGVTGLIIAIGEKPSL